MSSLRLSCVGFCGVDDSIHPDLLCLLSCAYPGQLEWGLLLRPDRQPPPSGSPHHHHHHHPRYPTPQYLERITQAAARTTTAESTPTTKIMRLAAHVCGSLVHDLLSEDPQQQQQQQHGDDIKSNNNDDDDGNANDDFFVSLLGTSEDTNNNNNKKNRYQGSRMVSMLLAKGFNRLQINATAVNGVDTKRLFQDYYENEKNRDQTTDAVVFVSKSCRALLRLAHQFPDMEFIVQKNEESKPLWHGLFAGGSSSSSNDDDDDDRVSHKSNIVLLVDESKGTGRYHAGTDDGGGGGWPAVTSLQPFRVGYAGGIGPHNVRQVVHDLNTIHRNNKTNNNNDTETNQSTTNTNTNTNTTSIWIDMESSLRTKVIVENDDQERERDVFDINKVYQVIDTLAQLGYLQKKKQANTPLLKS